MTAAFLASDVPRVTAQSEATVRVSNLEEHLYGEIGLATGQEYAGTVTLLCWQGPAATVGESS